MPKTFPSGAEIYAARFEAGLTYGEMRSHFSVSARSSRFLAECGEFVRSNAELLAKHPEFAAIDGAAATDVANPAYVATRETIRTERMRGVGFAVLADRTGLPVAKLRSIVGEEVGTTARVAYGARYGSRKVAETEETPEETPETDGAEETPETGADGPEHDPAETATEREETASADADGADADGAEETAPKRPARRRRSRKATDAEVGA